jgi:splicing factor 4
VRREAKNAQLLGKIVDLEERLRLKVKDVEVLELKCDENEGLCRKLVEEVELLKCEVKDEKLKRNRLNEAYKRLKSQHVYLRKKVGLNEENMIRESDFRKWTLCLRWIRLLCLLRRRFLAVN